MKYLFLLLPLSLFVLASFYNIKYNKMKNSGRIPDIITAKRNTALYLLLALTITCVFFIVLGYEA